MQRLDATDLDSSKLNLKPTWGISFGLPQTDGPYPINPYGGNPLVNPYGPGQTGQGLNLGLVSVNPLLAVQFSKDEYGDKVVKPFVNLHVTPNRHIVQKLGDLLAYKKQAIHGQYGHYGHYGPDHAPHYHYPPKPSVYYENHYAKPPYPVHSPVYHREPPPHLTADYSDYYRDDYDYDYEDRSLGDRSRYQGEARSNAENSRDRDERVDEQKLAGTAPSTGTSGKVSFPSRRKRGARSQQDQLRFANQTIEVSVRQRRIVG